MGQVFYLTGLSPSEKLILLALADHADDDTGRCWPSMATLAQKSCQSERNARRMIRNLEAQGYVKVDSRGGQPNQYIVTPNPDKLAAPTPDKSAHTPDTAMSGGADTAMSAEPSRTIKENHGGGRARDTLIDQIMGAAKADTSSSHWFDPSVWQAVSRWRGYGLDDQSILNVIHRVMERRTDPPASPAYFDKAMQREAEGCRPIGRGAIPIPVFEIDKVLRKREAGNG